MQNLIFLSLFAALIGNSVVAAPAVLRAAAFQLSFAADGKPASLRAGSDELLFGANPGMGFSLALKNAQVPLTDVFVRDDGKLVARSANGTQSVVFALHSGAKHITFRLEELKGVPASSPIALQFQMNTSARARVLELDYMTQARSDGDGPRVTWSYLWHRADSKNDPLGGFALYVRDNEADEDDTLLHIWAEEKLPHPKVAGEWTYERARQWISDWQKLFADRSQMILEGASLAELREAIPFAERAQIKEIYLFTNTWRTDAFWPRTDTSWGVNRKVFPRGEDDLTAFAAELRAKGIRLNLHYVSGGIGPLDPLYMAAKPDRRLASWGNGTTDAVDATAKEIVFHPSPGVELPFRGDILGRPPEVPEFFEFDIVRLDDELVRVGEFAPQNDGSWLLKNCTRGLFSKAASHAANAPAAGLLNAYGQNFVPDNDSTLLDEIATNYADLLNRCGIAHSEYDGAEIHCYNGRWGFEKFATLVYEKLDHPVTSHSSSGLPPRCHFEYRLNSTQKLLRGSNAATHGNYAVPVQLASNSRVASTILDANFTLSQGNLGGALGISKPEPMFGINAQTLRAHGLTDRFIQTLLNWKAISRALTEEQRTQLNHWFVRTPSQMPEHSQHPASPVVPVAQRTKNGYEIVPTRVLVRKSGDIMWQQGQEHGPISPRQFIKPGEELTLQNPDAPQTPHFIVRVGWALDANAKPVAPETSNIGLQPSANALHAAGDTIAVVEGNALRLSQNNPRDTERWETKLFPSWNPSVDMTSHRAIGMDITGDGSGATLLLQINGRDYVVPLDFKGRRHVEIPNGEVAWSSGAWGWRMDTKQTDYAHINTLKIGFGFVPPRTNASVSVENLQALAELPTALQNPTFHIGGGTLAVQGSITSNQYLEYAGGENATVYDENWQKIKDLPLTAKNFTVPTGEVKISLTTTQTALLPWLETQFLTEGAPIVVGE